jgi:hypothetical protein
MEESYQAIRLPAYSVNRTKRLIKAPKLYWGDTALALYLAGETEPRGAHLENLVLTDLLAWRACAKGSRESIQRCLPRRLMTPSAKSLGLKEQHLMRGTVSFTGSSWTASPWSIGQMEPFAVRKRDS